MKTDPLPLVCTVQSITDHTGRRILKLTRNAPDSAVAPVSFKRRKSSFRLKMRVVSEAAFSFEPVIKVRAQSKS